MLAYFLAILVAITSLSLYLNAFIRPKIHRKDDFLWSGLGLFYALVLWICAGRMTGAVLLGQTAGVAVAIAFIWENIQLRATITAQAESNQVLEGFSVLSFIAQSLTKLSQLGTKKASPIATETKTQPMKETEKKETNIETTDTQEKIEEIKSSEEVKGEIEEIKSSEEVKKEIKEVKEGIETIEENLKESVKEKSIDEEKPLEIADNSEDNLIQDTSENELPTEEEKGIPTVTASKQETLEDIREENKTKVNLFGRIRNIFRKSPEKSSIKDELPESILDEIDDIEAEIDPETTAVEVEEAIANLDITEATQEEKKETSETIKTPINAEEKEEIITNDESTPDLEKETDKPVETIAEVTEAENEVNPISEQIENTNEVITEITESENEANPISEEAEKPVETIAEVTESENETNAVSEEIENNNKVITEVTQEEKTSDIELKKQEEKAIPPEDTIASLDELKINNEE